MHGKRVLIEIDRRRFRCKFCGKTMFEPLPDVDKKRLATSRLIEYIERRCLGETFIALSRETGLDNKTIRNIFDDYVARKNQAVQIKTPEILGIDEIKIIGDYRATLTNIDKLTLFDLLQTRKKASLLDYFDAMSDKQNVLVIVMDMWNVYRQVAAKAFPGRMVVADKFHVVRMANDALERVRKRIRKSVDDKTRLKLKDDRFILLKRAHKLTQEEAEKAEKWFALYPELNLAYAAKERFYDIYTKPTREAAELAAREWEDRLGPSIAREFRELRVALNNWWQEIFNFYEQPVTNGYTEAINGIAKNINRMGRGYSFEVIRARLLFDETAMRAGRATVRKKPRRTPDQMIGRMIGVSGAEAEETIDYGAHLPTLVSLLESGYFS